MIEFQFVSSSGNLTLDESSVVSHNPVKVHTGKADLRATFEYTPELENYIERFNRVNLKLNGSTEWTGYLVGGGHNEKQGTTSIRADGVAKRLEETRPNYQSLGGPLVYTSIALDDAIRDYWSRTPFNATVTDQNTTLVAENQALQSADTNAEWGNVVTIGTNEPLKIRNGNIELLESCFFDDGDDFTTTGTSAVADTKYAGQVISGSAATAAELNSTGDTVEYTFETEYPIPADRVGFYVREETTSFATDSILEIEYSIDGDVTDTMSGGQSVSFFGWVQHGADAIFGGDGYNATLPAGTHTLKIELTNVDSGNTHVIDSVAVFDNSFSYTFDNSTTLSSDGNYQLLNGPELYPIFAKEFTVQNTNYNIVSADVTTSWNNTSNQQSLAVSNDNGANYISQSNTETLTANFASQGRGAIFKPTFSRWGSRETDNPATGFNGQSIQSYTLDVDLNDRIVIDKLSLSRNHFDNLKTLHNYGEFNWVIEHDSSSISNLAVSSFYKQDESRPSPPEFTNPINKKPDIKGGTYYNSIYLEGALDDATGTRPTAEVKDQTAINNADREISPGVLRDLSITTEAGAEFRAQALLDTALSNNELTGSIETTPLLIHPGYAREIDLGNGKQLKTVERVSLTGSQGDVSSTIDFVVNEGFAEDIAGLRSDAKNLQNQV